MKIDRFEIQMPKVTRYSFKFNRLSYTMKNPGSQYSKRVDSLSQELISIVIPVFNEYKNITKTLSKIKQNLPDPNYNTEIILVDDGSTDASWNMIQTSTKSDPSIKGIKLSRNFGKEAAITAGLHSATGDAVIIMDCDLQHPPSLLPQFIETWKSLHVDIVEGRKENRGSESLFMKAAAKIFYSSFHKTTGIDIRSSSDYRLLSRKALEAWKQLDESSRFFRGMSQWIGFPRHIIYFKIENRSEGKTSWNFVSLSKLAIEAITSFTAAPLQIITITGLIFFFFSLALGFQTLYMFFSGRSTDGFTTVILLLLIIGATVMLGLGCIGLYISKIYEEVKRRPVYLISESTTS